MAPISKLLSFLILTTLSFSLQIHARDSQFFSKVTHVNNVKDKDVPNPNYEKPLNKPEQEPVFIPETENSYGLYGHESGLHPPTTTNNGYNPNTYQSYEQTSSLDQTNKNNVNNNNYYSYQKNSYDTKYPHEISDTSLTETSYTNKGYNPNEFSNTKFPEDGYNPMENQNKNNDFSDEFSNKKFPEDGYNPMEKQNKNNDFSDEFSNKKFPEEGYNSMEKQNYNNYNKKYYYNNNVAANDKYYFKNNVANNNNYNNGERQGMSDTRAMEGGRYYYDVNSEKYNPTFDRYSSKGVVNSENWYNKNGYFGKNNNNVNTYENNKYSMEGNYKNQEEFEDDQDVFEP